MSDFTFDELKTLCAEIHRRGDEGERYPEVVGRSDDEVLDLLSTINEASRTLQKMAYYLLQGGIVAIHVRTNAEWDEWYEQVGEAGARS